MIKEESTPSDTKDTLLLLLESIFSVTQRIHAGGEVAEAPVEAFAHLYGRVQMQILGYHDLLTPFKMAQILQGMAIAGGTIGYRRSSVLVFEDGEGQIARVDIR